MARRFLGTLLVLVLLRGSAWAQVVFPGSTPVGDYLRGVGIAAAGMGVYNYNTAQANAINVQTEITWNEYVAAVIKNENRENAEHRARMHAQRLEDYKKTKQRIRDNPEALDVLKGDSLNDALSLIQDPKYADSSFRYAQVPLSVDDVRRIRFKLAERNEKFSMQRLTVRGTKRWPVGLQDDRFASLRQAYERTVDKALEEAADGKMQIPTIDAIEKAADNLSEEVEQVYGKQNNDIRHIEAIQKLKELKDTARFLRRTKVEHAIGDIDKYSGTTVYDLMVFMRKHNLWFADAENPEERKLYPELYALLKQQLEKLSGAGAEK
jgi:hypothetical protein